MAGEREKMKEPTSCSIPNIFPLHARTDSTSQPPPRNRLVERQQQAMFKTETETVCNIPRNFLV